MARKTYVPGLVNKTNGLNRYLGRWQQQLQTQATTPAKVTALANLVACIAEFLSEWHKPDVQP